MGYEHSRRFQHHKLHQKNIHIQYRSPFLPVLCSPSVKDVSGPPPVSVSIEPLSPRIGCMGQVKRSNKIVGYPVSHGLSLTAKSNDSASINGVKYFKLKKLFSGKKCTSAATVVNNSAALSAFSSRSRTQVDKGNWALSKNTKCRNDSCESINIDLMDPPLPVMKKMPKPAEGCERDNLWRRRSGGVALKNLQLKQLPPLGHLPESTTV